LTPGLKNRKYAHSKDKGKTLSHNTKRKMFCHTVFNLKDREGNTVKIRVVVALNPKK
jgi:hypothetical protein